MTPKEKAEELIHKFILNTPVGFHFDDAKQCALIAVDEILKSLGEDDIVFENEDEIDFTSFFKYWREVKQEIEML